MADAFDVAKFLIHLANSEEEPDALSHLRLQKLLYYAQGWSLAVRDSAMFENRIEGWVHGPVVVDVYPKFTKHGFASLPPKEYIFEHDKLNEDEMEFVTDVWAEYKMHSAICLRKMTHNEPPWIDARKNLGPLERGTNEITKDSMLKFFSSIKS